MTRSGRNELGSLTYEEIFHPVENGLLVDDADTGAILDTNQAAEYLYGYSSGEFLKGDISDFPSFRT